MKDLVLTKTLTLTDPPTKATLQEAYENAQTEGLKDTIVLGWMHHGATMFLKRGTLKAPGTYEISIHVKMPIMFWHKVHYTIRKL